MEWCIASLSPSSTNSLSKGLRNQILPLKTLQQDVATLLQGIRLAAGELTLRAAEERRRIAAGSQAGPLLQARMSGAPGPHTWPYTASARPLCGQAANMRYSYAVTPGGMPHAVG